VLLGDAWYCPFDPCGAVVLQVHGAINDPDAVDRATQSSAWRGSAGHRAQRERAGLVPELPPDPRRRRAVEDLEVDRDAPEAVELVHDEETESEGSDASASPPATQKETPMPDPDRIPPSALILDLLRRRAPLTRREITNVVL
jgi:hypothetical protein